MIICTKQVSIVRQFLEIDPDTGNPQLNVVNYDVVQFCLSQHRLFIIVY